jgi:hypothetical protein
MTIQLDRERFRRAYFRNRTLRRPLNWFRYTGVAPNDLFVVSYPRSGTTWLRFLLFELLTGEPAEFVSVNDWIPYIGRHRGIRRLLPNGGRVIQSHETFLRGVGAGIYVVRDPRSVVLSEYRWQLRTGLFQESFDRFFDRFVSGGANPYGGWDEHVRVWVESELAARGGLHVVRFEDLKANAVQELEGIMDFLRVRTTRSQIERAVSNNDLAQMRAKEERAPDWAVGSSARPDIRFVNTGSTSHWKEELKSDQVTRLERAFGPTLRRMKYVPTVSTPSPASMNGRATEQASHDRLKVIYIAGWGRSGSTLLDNLLGQIDGFFSTGELRYIWERGVLGGWKCGCGQSVKECEVWSRVLAKLQAGEEMPDATTIMRWQRAATRLRHTWQLLKMNDGGPGHTPVLQPYLRIIGNLYASVAEATQARVIVDSSKRPSDAAILDLVPGIELYVIHLVRDPRAVAFSWSKHQAGIDRHGVVESTGSWVAWNLASGSLRKKLLDRSILLRYEDFVARPVESLERIVSLVGEDVADIPPMRDGVFELKETHTVSGNPARFRMGSVRVLPDDQWLERLGTARTATATMLALPLLHRYGYPISTRRASGSFRHSIASPTERRASVR